MQWREKTDAHAMRGLSLVSIVGIPVPRLRIGEMSHAVFCGYSTLGQSEAGTLKTDQSRHQLT